MTLEMHPKILAVIFSGSLANIANVSTGLVKSKMVKDRDHIRHATWTSSVRNLVMARSEYFPKLLDVLPLGTGAL